MVRDYALAASGLLSKKMYGPSVKPYQPEAIWDIVGLPGGDTRNYQQDTGDDIYRRTLYTFWKRMAPPPNLEAFNAPSREVCTVSRERTNTPLQAFVTLNDPQFVEAARRLAERALQETKSAPVSRDSDSRDPVSRDLETSNFIAAQVLGRPLNAQEQATLMEDRDQYLNYYNGNLQDAQALVSVGESKADAAIDVPMLAAWTMVCNEVLNLDETLNK